MSKEEEDAVLATLQATLHDQSAYEEEVIREATHSLAPDLPNLGLPTLESLSTSGVVPPAQVHEVLGRVRKQQRESDNDATIDLHCMKEQILLRYMETVCGVQLTEDDEPPSVQEQRLLLRRKRRMRKETPKSNSAIAAIQNIEESAAIPRRAVKRRKVQKIVDDDDDPLIVDAKERQEIEARRLERKKRKEARRRQKQLAEIDEEEEHEAEFDDEGMKQETVDDEIAPPPLAAAAVGGPTDGTQLDTTPSISPLICPLCTKDIGNTSEDPVERDNVLAHHMQDCQSMGRRSRRARGSPAVPSTPSIDVAVTAPRIGHSTTRNRKKTAGIITARNGPSLDDLEESAYEDRIDDWIENGLSRMKEMKELIDTGEGIADDGPWQEYGEGFFVPAWIHRRLFGYQREGLKWMWGLHQQGCGGCLGDEVSKYRTICYSQLSLAKSSTYLYRWGWAKQCPFRPISVH